METVLFFYRCVRAEILKFLFQIWKCFNVVQGDVIESKSRSDKWGCLHYRCPYSWFSRWAIKGFQSELAITKYKTVSLFTAWKQLVQFFEANNINCVCPHRYPVKTKTPPQWTSKISNKLSLNPNCFDNLLGVVSKQPLRGNMARTAAQKAGRPLWPLCHYPNHTLHSDM